MSITRQVGHNVRRARLAAKMSQESLAHEAGLAMNYVSGIERGLRNPTIKVVEKLAKALGIAPLELFRPVSTRETLAQNLKPGRRATKS